MYHGLFFVFLYFLIFIIIILIHGENNRDRKHFLETCIFYSSQKFIHPLV